MKYREDRGKGDGQEDEKPPSKNSAACHISKEERAPLQRADKTPGSETGNRPVRGPLLVKPQARSWGRKKRQSSSCGGFSGRVTTLPTQKKNFECFEAFYGFGLNSITFWVVSEPPHGNRTQGRLTAKSALINHEGVVFQKNDVNCPPALDKEEEEKGRPGKGRRMYIPNL